jgi:hypothetical protein
MLSIESSVDRLPNVKYVVDMDVVFLRQNDSTPNDKTHMYQFMAKTPRLTPTIINQAYQSFKSKFQHGSWYEDIDIVDHRIHKVQPFGDTILGAIQLLAYKRLPHKLFPDDVVVNSTPNECVIDGMLAFLRKWKQFDREHYFDCCPMFRHQSGRLSHVVQIRIHSWVRSIRSPISSRHKYSKCLMRRWLR